MRGCPALVQLGGFREDGLFVQMGEYHRQLLPVLLSTAGSRRSLPPISPCLSHALRLHTGRQSAAGEGHGFNQDRPGADVAIAVHVVADGNQSAIHVLEIAGDGDLFDWVLDFAVLHPEAGRAA